MAKELTMSGLGDNPTQVLSLSEVLHSGELSEFFMPPHYDLDALMSEQDQKWFRVLLAVSDSICN